MLVNPKNTQEEIDAGKILECRNIVKNLINFGVSEKQKIKIIELLAMELESRDAMQLILNTANEIKKMDQNIKFSLTIDHEDYNGNTKKLLDV